MSGCSNAVDQRAAANDSDCKNRRCPPLRSDLYHASILDLEFFIEQCNFLREPADFRFPPYPVASGICRPGSLISKSIVSQGYHL